MRRPTTSGASTFSIATRRGRARVATPTPLGIDVDTWDQVLRTNTTGALAPDPGPCCRPAAGPRRGAIVYISSGSAAVGEHRRLAYGVSKAGIEQLMRHVAARYGREGVRANAVAPGFILTDSAARGVRRSSTGARRPEPARPVRVARGRGPAWSGFSCRTSAAFVTGQVIRVDGGLSVSPRLTADGSDRKPELEVLERAR